jgi:hypothetical protein
MECNKYVCAVCMTVYVHTYVCINAKELTSPVIICSCYFIKNILCAATALLFSILEKNELKETWIFSNDLLP